MRNLIVVAVLVLSGCAAQSPIKDAWTVADDDIWRRHRQSGVWLEKQGVRFKFIRGSVLTNLLRAKDDIQERSFVRAHLAIVETDSINAFAVTHGGKDYVAFSISYLDEFGNDRDAIATTMGHEMAHLRLGHNGAARKEREGVGRAASTAAGLVASAVGIPMGGLLADIGGAAIVNSFSRDEERAADEQGLRWATEAGYDACGQIRVAAALGKLGAPAFLSTHPGYAERSELANQYAVKSTGAACPEY
jgi:predicted Zn-dependent protease